MRHLSPQEFYRLLNRIAEGQVGNVEVAFLAAIKQTVDAIRLPELVSALQRGDVQAVLNAVNIEAATPRLRKQLETSLRTVYIQAGIAAVATLPEGIGMRFDIVNPRAVKWARRYAAQMVTQINESSKDTIRRLIARGLRGRTIQTTAKGIGQVLAKDLTQTFGLTQRHYSAVVDYREKLEQRAEIARRLKAGQDRADIARELDVSPQLVGRIANRRWLQIGEDTVDARVERYAKRLLKSRATTIARETITAANAGNRETWRQAEEKGYFKFDQSVPALFLTPEGKRIAGPQLHPNCRCSSVVRVVNGVARQYWVVAYDDRLCPRCRAMPKLNPQGVGMFSPELTNLPVPIAA